MEIGELFLLAIGLSMDACAVAASNGISHRRLAPGEPLATAGVFGGFQGLMPLLGYLAGSRFLRYMARADHIIALMLLGYLGGRMLWAGLAGGDNDSPASPEFCWKTLLLQPFRGGFYCGGDLLLHPSGAVAGQGLRPFPGVQGPGPGGRDPCGHRGQNLSGAYPPVRALFF